jgi:hypothetical protein
MPRPPSLRDGDTPTRTGSLISRCPTCDRINRADEEELSGSSDRSFLCMRCGAIRYRGVPPWNRAESAMGRKR